MRTEVYVTGERLKNLRERYLLLLSYFYRGVGEGSSSELTHFPISLCLKEGVLTPSFGKAPSSICGTSPDTKTAVSMVLWF